MIHVQGIATHFIKDDRGAAAIEYALLASLVAVALIGAFTALSSKISDAFVAIGNKLPTD